VLDPQSQALESLDESRGLGDEPNRPPRVIGLEADRFIDRRHART
jgi:hypothetical protein